MQIDLCCLPVQIVAENHIGGTFELVGGYLWSLPVISGEYLQFEVFMTIFGVLIFMTVFDSLIRIFKI